MTSIQTKTTGLLVLTLAGSLACAGGTGGGTGNLDRDVVRQPNADFGMGATIIMPGQQPPMPGSPGASPRGGNLTWIGGANQQEETRFQRNDTPTKALSQKLGGPGAAVVGGPLAAMEAARRRFKGEDQEQAQEGQGTPEAPSGSATTQTPTGQTVSQRQAPAMTTVPSQPVPTGDPHSDIESARLLDLERELAQQQPGGAGASLPVPPVPIPLPNGAARGGAEPRQHASAAPLGRTAIADELAVLQARIRPKTRPEDAAGSQVSRSEPAPRNGGVADQVSDRDGDGRPDHWVYRHQGRKVRELFDEDGDSAPDRTVYFDPKTGAEQSVEEDRNLDGRLDSWAEFRNGQMARQRRDTDHDGFLDTWIFYRDGQIAREEQDLNGDGFRNRVAFFDQGRIVREREDRDGDGRVDRVTLYDDQERVLRRDEDQDADGLIDTRSYYEEGRLARRELVEEAQQESVDQETLREPVWDQGPKDRS